VIHSPESVNENASCVFDNPNNTELQQEPEVEIKEQIPVLVEKSSGHKSSTKDSTRDFQTEEVHILLFYL
jgi:hypothetical protein